jgi:hypothetical protein
LKVFGAYKWNTAGRDCLRHTVIHVTNLSSQFFQQNYRPRRKSSGG